MNSDYLEQYQMKKIDIKSFDINTLFLMCITWLLVYLVVELVLILHPMGLKIDKIDKNIEILNTKVSKMQNTIDNWLDIYTN